MTIDTDIFYKNKPLTHEQLLEIGINRAKTKEKPYWSFIWKHPDTGSTGNVNFKMKKNVAIELFEKTHSGDYEYMYFGSDNNNDKELNISWGNMGLKVQQKSK